MRPAIVVSVPDRIGAARLLPPERCSVISTLPPVTGSPILNVTRHPESALEVARSRAVLSPQFGTIARGISLEDEDEGEAVDGADFVPAGLVDVVGGAV